MIGGIGIKEILLVFGVALLIFGPSKIPEIGKSFGKGIKEFKNASKEVSKSFDDEETETPKSKD